MTDEQLAADLNKTEATRDVAADDLLLQVEKELAFLKRTQMSPLEERLVHLLSATVKVLMVTRSRMGDVT